MAKKKKKKLKKKKAVKNQQIAQNNTSGVNPAEESLEQAGSKTVEDAPKETENIYEEIYKDERYSYIKKDVVKVLLLLLILIIILVAIYILDRSYSFLDPVGEWLYKIMNIQTQ